MSLSSLKKLKQREKKRVGRGRGSGKGSHTSGRGQKGQTSRSGNQIRAGFEGGQNPLYLRLPHKKGQRLSNKAASFLMSPKKRTKVQLTLNFLNQFADGETVNEAKIKEIKKIKGPMYVKVIDSGELTKKVTLENIKATKGAQTKIEKFGGKII